MVQIGVGFMKEESPWSVARRLSGIEVGGEEEGRVCKEWE